ncbi:Exported repetitive protein [Mycobacterium talmoniae]|uniref:Exported repetitive protein n=1 Tax=Mycobacterium talmoniae TaxID=1858794 RepID=A0A2S8BSI4_9MYCO|nr:Exported repetitive protein [Mycobacterium talmoniae]
MPNRRRRRLSTAMSAVAALAVSSPFAVVAVSDLTDAPQHDQFVQAAVVTDLPNELMSALSQGLSQFGINLPPVPTGLGGASTGGYPGMSPGLTSPGLTSPGLTSPGATPGLTSPGLTSPAATPGLTDPSLATPGATPGLTSPGLTDPGLTDPGLTNPAGTLPGATTPGLTSPAGMTGATTPGLSQPNRPARGDHAGADRPVAGRWGTGADRSQRGADHHPGGIGPRHGRHLPDPR